MRSRLLARTAAVAIAALASIGPAAAQETFVRGDANGDGWVDVSDPVALLLHLFAGREAPGCLDAGDADDDGDLGLTDSVRVLAFLFQVGGALPAPFPDCGPDPTTDPIGCVLHASCAAPVDVDPVITEWPVPWSGTRPRDPYTDADGRVWFVGQLDDYVAYLEPDSGRFTRFDLPDGAGPHNVIAGDSVWYAGNTASHIGRLPAGGGEVTVLPMPDPAARDPHTLVFDSLGDIWFTVQTGNFVGRLTTSTGAIRLARVPTSRSRPYGIVVDRDDRPWFVEFGSNKIAVIDRETFAIREHVLPRSGARPRRLGETSDGKLWYVDYSGGYLGRFDPATLAFDEWRLPGGSGSQPYGMAIDHRDRIWAVATGPRPNRFIGFNPASETFFSNVAIPSGGGQVRHMHFDAATRSIWFGTDAGTIGRAVVR